MVVPQPRKKPRISGLFAMLRVMSGNFAVLECACPIHRCGLSPYACLMHICPCYGALQSLPPAVMRHLDGKRSVLAILFSAVNRTPWMIRWCIDS